MEPKCSNYLEAPPFSSSHGGVGGRRKEKPFVDPLCELNLKETSFPMPKRNVVEPPPTPGRPVFSFSVGSRKKLVPSKWNDAEKWLVAGHHLHGFVKSADFDFVSRQSTSSSSNGVMIKPEEEEEERRETKVVLEKSEVTEQKDHRHHNSASDVLKDNFTNEVEPNFLKFKCWGPMSQGFLFENSTVETEVKCRDIGTEMTPLGSSTTSLCPTPFKSLSPPRHNTPTSRSGPLALMDANSSFDIGELQDCHLAKLQVGTVTSNWRSREEEEEDISKSLRHFEMSNECRKSISEPRACAWEEEDEEEKTKCCVRYQREKAKIQAWVNLENAKAEAQSRKLEVKIEKMRSKFEEKLLRKMGIVHRKAEELRAAAKLQHRRQIQKAAEQAKKTTVHMSGSRGCFPSNCNCNCNNRLHP